MPIIIKGPRGEKKIGTGEPCFIIAEVSANHNHDLETAKAIIRAAAAAGADAIKLQTYIPDSMTIDSRESWFVVGGEGNPESWKGGKTFYDLYGEAFTPREWHSELKQLTESLGMIFFSTAYAPIDVDFLETLDVALYKVASYEATDIPLLKYIAKTGKPIIMSVGFADLPEITLSIQTLRDAGVKDLVVLHCSTSYAATPDASAAHLATMLDMRDRFGVMVGFSENNGGIEIAALAAAAGACVLEKHITLEKGSGLDSQFSLTPDEFKEMVSRIRAQEKIIGAVSYGPQTPEEKYNRGFRRSLFAVADIAQGAKFTPENIRSIRPAAGLEPKYYDEVVGKTAATDIKRGTPWSWELIDR